mmetsp:Transcript_4853/g.17285  ORF Transcript_4853/g.17285 Transcript_4853/m.17285 type:complete len:145 (-) Transcript_4853:285-719(-)
MTTLQINGQSMTVEAGDDTPLLWVLRDHLGMTGTKFGCGLALCGACTVHLDGQPVRACQTPLSAASGKKIVTIEGVGASKTGQAVQHAWVKLGVPQCGYCQSGMLMSVAGAMNAGHHGAEIANEVDNLCVCGTYQRIKTAVAGL